MKKNIVISLFIIAATVLVGCTTETGPSDLDGFAACLTDKGVKMYGTEWCPHCKDQKAMFGSSFKSIDYIDCDLKKSQCTDANIEGYPTWILANGEALRGTQQLETLAEKTSCDLPSEDDVETSEES